MQSLMFCYIFCFWKTHTTSGKDMIKKIKILQQFLQLLVFQIQVIPPSLSCYTSSLSFYPQMVPPFPPSSDPFPYEQYRTSAGRSERIALEGLQPIKGSSATPWRNAAHKTKWYVCNLAQCLLTGPCSSILATAGGKGAGRRRRGALCTRVTSSPLHQPTTASLTPIASSAGCYKCQQCPPHSMVCAHI